MADRFTLRYQTAYMANQTNFQYPGARYAQWRSQSVRLRSREAGAAYVLLLITVAVMGIGLVAISEVWHITLRREKEQDLLFIGDQFRQAIGQYYALTPAGHAQRYPATLEDLLKDPRMPGTRRYLRKIFVDPMTGKREWGVVRGSDGGILGVRSLSEERPIKQTNFGMADIGFQGMGRYSDWVFVSGTGPMATSLSKQGDR